MKPPDEHARCVSITGNGEPVFTMPSGMRIFAQPGGDADPEQTGNEWASVDICAEYPNGNVDVLCTAEYEAESGKLRIFANDGKTDDLAYECLDYHFVEEWMHNKAEPSSENERAENL